MISIQQLPAVNAVLNSLSAVLLLIGYWFIRRNRIAQHRVCMVLAFCCSILFLTSYLIYHYYTGSKHFPGYGTARLIYLSILLSHTVLAALVPPLAIITLVRGVRGRFETHRRIARWTLPIWLYVSITGVVVYWMLYRMIW